MTDGPHSCKVSTDVKNDRRGAENDHRPHDPWWIIPLQQPCQAMPCNKSNSGAHLLNCYHHRVSDDGCPKKFQPKHCSSLRIGRNTRRVIITCARYDSRPKYFFEFCEIHVIILQ